jgi:beta-glucuronidase
LRARLITPIAIAAVAAGAAVPTVAAQPTTTPTTPALAPPPPPPTPRLVVSPPSSKTYIREGQAGRFLLGGRWYFRQDDPNVGMRQRWWRQRSLRGWVPVGVPSVWNATDTVLNQASIGWYRREFSLPRGPRGRSFQWKLRFQSATARATVWVNGKKVGQSRAGAYFPFEVDAPGLNRRHNRLVVRVSSLRSGTDLTHWRVASFHGFGSGGWWNFGGLNREVYLRRIDGVDIEDVGVYPQLRCVRCPARVRVQITLRNLARGGVRVPLALLLRGPGSRRTTRIDLPARGLRGKGRRTIHTTFTIRRPRLWQPGRARLYGLRVVVSTGGIRRSTYSLAFGVHKVQVRGDGVVLLNGHPLHLRGAAIHEDDPRTGSALTPGQRAGLLQRLRELHATITRAHYPLHPAFMEALDRAGILYWSDAPVYQVPVGNMAIPSVRRRAIQANLDTVAELKNHPSVLAWSLANELPDMGSGPQSRFITEAARAVRKADNTRLVAIDRTSVLGQADPIPALGALDAIGINDYLGWYNASSIGRPSQTSDLPAFLDRLHTLYPRTGLFVTEFGAESNRDGPVTEKGTYAFQVKWMTDHLAIYGSRPYVNGAVAWILKDFRVVPNWSGGNPKPTPPWDNKGLIDETGALKPAFSAMSQLYGATPPLR